MKNETLKEAMEEPRSVSSPRRILSLSKKKRASVSFSDPDDKASGFGLSGEHGPKPSEVYGFVGSITTIVATGLQIMLHKYTVALWFYFHVNLLVCECDEFFGAPRSSIFHRVSFVLIGASSTSLYIFGARDVVNIIWLIK